MKKAANVDKRAQPKNINKGTDSDGISLCLNKYGISQNMTRKARNIIEGGATFSDPRIFSTIGILVIGRTKSITTQSPVVIFW
jgi:hypothetical protein